MRASDLDTVNQLFEIHAKCHKALDDIHTYMNDRGGPDSGGIEGFEYGFWAAFSTHKDGSGPGADLTGCYVGTKVADAIEQILKEQIVKVEDRLIELGVTLEARSAWSS